jgi:hypothetical protein
MKSETSILQVTGAVHNPLRLSNHDLLALPWREIHQFPIVCATTQQVLDIVPNARGVPLSVLLRQAQPDQGAAKSIYRALLYVVVSAQDGYRCLFSWHELMNTAHGDSALLLYRQAQQLLPSPSLLVTSDIYTAPRAMRNVAQIEVMRLAAG